MINNKISKINDQKNIGIAIFFQNLYGIAIQIKKNGSAIKKFIKAFFK